MQEAYSSVIVNALKRISKKIINNIKYGAVMLDLTFIWLDEELT